MAGIQKVLSTFLVLLTIIFINTSVIQAQQLPLSPSNTEDVDIVFKPVVYKDALTPIFTFFSKTYEICRQQNLCSIGQYKDYAPVTNIVIFKGEKQPRYKRASIMWEVKFLEFSPTKITYGNVPYNGREIVKAKPLEPGEVYSVCVYPKNSSMHCIKWNFDK
jgi:hypothetical protein